MRDLLDKEFFFQLHPTGTEAHHQNGLIERPIRLVKSGIRCMLWGGHLLIMCWLQQFLE
jgi:hypothetical protein